MLTSLRCGSDLRRGETGAKGKKKARLSDDARHALNAICPYFTMFPLEFPTGILARRGRGATLVLDPFCGRGTTLYAARRRGARAVGIDCSPVAVAISRAKLATFSVEGPIALARALLERGAEAPDPQGDFWRLAFHGETLRDLCRLRAGLLAGEDSDATVLLRAVILGVLHGPRTKVGSYLSNQMPRTFSPKPDYAVKFWTARGLAPARIGVLDAIERKLRRMEAGRYGFTDQGWRDVHLGDSSLAISYADVPRGVDAVITSPPYYGMRTYLADQWLRYWFLGGPERVAYTEPGDLPTSSPNDFMSGLGWTWANVAAVSSAELKLFVRFGTLPSQPVDARRLLLGSLEASGLPWRVVSIRNARTAEAGRRQVGQMRTHGAPVEEFDLHAVRA